MIWMEFLLQSVISDEAFSKLMIEEGDTTVVDEDGTYTMELPEWADANKIKR